MRGVVVCSTLGSLLLFAACSDGEKNNNTPDSGVRADVGGGNMDASVGEDVVESMDVPTGMDAHEGVDIADIPRDPNCPQASKWLTAVVGQIVDDHGAANAGSKAQLCVRTAPGDVLLCLRPKDTESD